MMKKIIMLVVVGAFAFAVAACGTAQTSGTPSPTVEPTVEPTATPSLSETDASAFEFEQKEDGTIKIIDLKNNSLEVVVIPKEINEMAVTEIGDAAFLWCANLTSIEIPSSVTSIGEGAFAYCSSLTSIEIPTSVTSIEDGAFEGCFSLTSIEIPSSVTSIGDYAFNSGIIVFAPKGSYAEQWAEKNGYNVQNN